MYDLNTMRDDKAKAMHEARDGCEEGASTHDRHGWDWHLPAVAFTDDEVAAILFSGVYDDMNVRDFADAIPRAKTLTNAP